ncbi:MAG: CCA tRNA nucleotidyltransferase, partial [Bacilli bacterium]|nr:CCA tRNA nucleotidyltransferase [Bacilli bacterium]
MSKLIKKVLNSIEKEGYEAYLIGGYVRDLLLGTFSSDIDICTNATPDVLHKIFPASSTDNIGGISFQIKDHNFEITTYREELKYEKRRPVKFNYINDLSEDLKRRDFTINSIAMNSKGIIIDLLNGISDLKNNTLKMIGDPETKLNEDPLRTMRALRIATTVNLTLEENLAQAVLKYNKNILKLSSTRIKEELDKILLS